MLSSPKNYEDDSEEDDIPIETRFLLNIDNLEQLKGTRK